MNKLSEFDLGWIVGIMEGEGWVVPNPKTLRASVAMVDYDTIELFHKTVGIGHLTERKFKRKQDQLQWNLGILEDLEEFLTTLLPFMGVRRKAQYEKVIEVLIVKREYREWCEIYFRCGHEKSEENTYHFPATGPNKGKTACRQCSRERGRRK